MALAETTTPTSATDVEPKAPPAAPSPAPAPATPSALDADVTARAKALYLKSGGTNSLPWDELSEGTRQHWRDRILNDGRALSDPPAPPKAGGYVPAAVHEIPQEVDPLLVQILSWPRKHGSWSELAFCKWLREHIEKMGQKPLIMAEGCILVTVRPAPRQEGKTLVHPRPSTTLFSCHVDTIEGTDTVASAAIDGADGPVPARKKLTYDPNFGTIALDKESIGGSLGADDGAGVYILLKLIEAKVPGTYVFHRGEECGGIGSAAMRDKYQDILKEFETAIAFDRHDTYEVIYHQGGMKCASMKFTEALCAALNKQGFKYQPSTRGTFTDTKNYRKIIPECVNIAVGYESQHGRNESLDYSHLAALAKAVCRINWDALPIDRDPSEADYSGGYGGGYGSGYSGIPGGYGRSHGQRGFDDDDFAFPQGGKGAKKTKTKKKQPARLESGPALSTSDEMARCTLEEIEVWCADNPLDAARAIGELMLEIAQLQASRDMLMKLMGWQDE